MTDRNDGPWEARTTIDPSRDPAPSDSADMSGDDPPTTRVSESQRVVLLDRVSSSSLTEYAPQRSDSAAGGIVVVATGRDSDRIRKLCHERGLLVPVMASLAVVHEAMSVVVIGEPSPPAPERVVHVVRSSLPDESLVDLLRALVSGHVVVEPPAAPATDRDPAAADIARRLASITDRAALERTTCDALVALIGADRAHCLFHDPATGALWSEARRRATGDDRRAMGGLVGFAARTGQPIEASPAGDDVRWLQELDDPDGKPQSRLLVQPIIGADRRVHAVLVAVRRWSHADFSARDKRLLASFAGVAARALDLGAAAPAVASTVASASASASAASAPVTTRPARTTLPGAAPRTTRAATPPAVVTTSRAAAAAAVVATPRASTDSRPPPVTARDARARSPSAASTTPPLPPAARVGTGTGTAPTPVAAGRRAPSDVPSPVDETRVDAPPPATDETRIDGALPDERYSSESIASLPSPPSVVRPMTPSAPSPGAEKPLPVPVSAGVRLPEADARAPVANRRPPAAHAATDAIRPARATSDPRDLAVVVHPDHARRVERIAKKARLEVSTFGKLADAPDFYAIVTVGEAWSQASDARIVYAARTTIADDQLADLLVGLSTRRAIVAAPAPTLARPHSAAEARRSQLAFAGARQLAAASDLAAAEESVTATLHELLDIDRAYCLFVDPETGHLWSERRRRAGGDERRAIAGIAGWCARTGRAASVARASADPRYLAPIDDPAGDPNSQLVVQPLIRSDERVHGVLVAVRRPRRPGFTDTDAALLARYAALASTQLEQLAAYVDTLSLIGDEASAGGTSASASAAATSGPTEPLWLQVARGHHALAHWVFLTIGVLLGLLLALLL
jgi:GAF domain-containing protein